MNKNCLKIFSNEKLIVALICLLLFSTGFLRGGVQLVLADISNIYSIGAAGVGILVAVQNIPPIIMPPLMGSVSDKSSKKLILVLFTVIFSAGSIVCGISNELWIFITGIILYKSGSSVCETVSTAVLSDINEKKSQQYINISQFFFSVGAVTGPLIVQLFMNKTDADWRFPFYLSTAAFAIIAILMLLFSFPKNKAAEPAKAEASTAEDYANSSKTLGDCNEKRKKASFISPLFICMFLAILLYNGMECGMGSFIDSLFDEKFTGSMTNAIAISCFWAGMSAMRLILGTRKYPAGKMLRICFIFSAVTAAILYFTRIIPVAISACLVSGILFGPIWCTIMSTSANNSEGNSGAVVGWLITACGIGGVIVPGLMGMITASFSVNAALLVIVSASVIAAVLCLKVKD